MRRVNGPPYKQSQRFNHIVEFTHVKLCILTKERSVSHSRRTGSSGPVAWQESEAESEKCRQERTFQVCCFTARLILVSMLPVMTKTRPGRCADSTLAA